jgi:hypothetical protein
MNLLAKDTNTIENSEDVGRAVVSMVENNLDVKHWNFNLTFTKFVKMNSIKIVYRSNECQIKFLFSRQCLPQYDELTILYGRLHAPNEDPFMMWEGQECNCWHNVLDPLRFLDGLTPHEAMEQVKVLKQLPVVVRGFRESDIGKKLLAEYPPKSAIALQSVLWKHYGQRLFDLFDLRKPDLWQGYQKFLREYYELLGEKSSYGPPYENVC